MNLKPHQVDLIITSGPVRDEFAQKVKELDRRLKMNGMDYKQWDTLTDHQHEIFSDNLFLDGECAASPENYVRGAVDSCWCPDVVEDLHHHSPVLMREIEKQQEMAPDMTVKISENLGFLNEMIDKELLMLLEQSYERRFEPIIKVDPFGAQVGSGDIEDYEERDFEKVRVPIDKKKKKTPTPAEIEKAAQKEREARIKLLNKMSKRSGNKGDKYEIDVVKTLIGDDPMHTLLAGRDVIAGSSTKADAAIAIDGKVYDIELKVGPTDPMSSGGINAEFEADLGAGEDGLKWFKGSAGLPLPALKDFLKEYSKTELRDDMAKLRKAAQDFEYPDDPNDPRLIQSDGKYYFFSTDKKGDKKIKSKPVILPENSYEKTALEKFNKFAFNSYPGVMTTAAWDSLGSEVDVGMGIRRKADRYNTNPIRSSSDFIKTRYNNKGVYYIQVGGRGLYLLGDEDPAGLKKYDVPSFDIGDEVGLELRAQANKSDKSLKDAKAKINKMENLTDQEREYLLSRPEGFYRSVYLRFSARLLNKGEDLAPSPVTLDSSQSVLELVNKLCDDNRYTGIPTLSPQGEVMDPEALSYCALRKLDSEKKKQRK